MKLFSITSVSRFLSLGLMVLFLAGRAEGQTKQSVEPSKGKMILEVKGGLGSKSKSDHVWKSHKVETVELKMQPMFVYTIEVESKDFDTVLRLETASGKQIAFNDDIDSNNLNSRIRLMPSDVTGKYTVDLYKINVLSYCPAQSGNFTLKIYEMPTY